MSEGKPRHRDVRRAGPSTVSIGMEYREVSMSGVTMKPSGGDTMTITGSPIVYSTPYKVRDSMGEFDEIMHPGVVTDLLAKKVDCRLLTNHTGMPLARTTSGTMQLRDTDKALTFSAQLDVRSQAANDLLVAIERGDVSQMSVGMVVGRDSWNQSQTTRQVYQLKDLVDVSAVTYPASPTTSIEVLRAAGAGTASYLSAPDVKVQRLIMSATEEYRIGKKISKATAGKLLAAHGALKDAGLGVSAATDHIANLLTLNGYSSGLSSGDGSATGPGGGQQAPGSPGQFGDGTGSRMTVHSIYPTLDDILADGPNLRRVGLLGDTIAAWKEEERVLARAIRSASEVTQRRNVDLST